MPALLTVVPANAQTGAWHKVRAQSIFVDQGDAAFWACVRFPGVGTILLITFTMGSGTQSLRITIKLVLEDLWSSRAGGGPLERARRMEDGSGVKRKPGLEGQSTGDLCRRIYEGHILRGTQDPSSASHFLGGGANAGLLSPPAGLGVGRGAWGVGQVRRHRLSDFKDNQNQSLFTRGQHVGPAQSQNQLKI